MVILKKDVVDNINDVAQDFENVFIVKDKTGTTDKSNLEMIRLFMKMTVIYLMEDGNVYFNKLLSSIVEKETKNENPT